MTHNGAVASLVACAAALHRIRGRIEGPWDAALRWVDAQLNRLWQARGAFPGLGSALSAFGYEWGFQHGSLLAYEIELERERKGSSGNVWQLVDAVMKDPARLDGPMASSSRRACARGGSVREFPVPQASRIEDPGRFPLSRDMRYQPSGRPWLAPRCFQNVPM